MVLKNIIDEFAYQILFLKTLDKQYLCTTGITTAIIKTAAISSDWVAGWRSLFREYGTEYIVINCQQSYFEI